MSSVKAKFPSISIKRRPKNSSAPAVSSPPGGVLRPLTPEANRKSKSSGQPAVSPTESKAFVPIQSPNIEFAAPIFPRDYSDTNLAALESLSRSFPDIRGSRHARSVSQPNKPIVLHRDSVSSAVSHNRSSSINSETSFSAEYMETPMIDQEDIIALTHHVRGFSEALACLRNTFIESEESQDGLEVGERAHLRLGEVLSILKGVLNKYKPLNSTEILASAGTLISKVKSHNYGDRSNVPDEFYEAIDQLALAFSSSVSDFLMGDQEPLPGSTIENSRSLDDLCDEDDEVAGLDERGYEEDSEGEHDQEYLSDKPDRKEAEKREVDTSAEKANELDKSLLELEQGVDIALQRTKIWSKYSKDIATYVERRAHLEMEYTNKLAKLAQTTKSSIMENTFLPFQSIFITALEQDLDYAEMFGKTCNALMGNRFMEPLNLRRTSHERTRKNAKDRWTKACKKLNEALVNLKKAKSLYIQKQQELDKAEAAKDKDESSSAGLSFGRIQKKKDVDKKADDAEDWYRQCVHEANTRQKELEAVKSQVLVELRQQVYQCDQTMKAVTCTYFQMMNTLSSQAPVQFQTLADSSRMYEPGTHFANFVRKQKETMPAAVFREFSFEPYQPESTSGSSQSPSRHYSTHSVSENPAKHSPFPSRRHQSLNLRGNHSVAPSPWVNLSDAESGRSAPSSPNGSPSSGRKAKERARKAYQASSEESDGGQESDDGKRRSNKTRVPPRKHRGGKSRPTAGPFQNCCLSAAAETHSLRKLRSPSKCRDCDSYVYFNGAECHVCGVTCHKKCLAKLSIKCGNQQRAQRRMTTFGVSLHHQLKDGELVPYIVSSCISEIDSRGLEFKGIYRVSGVKSTVEKLCQAFETDSNLVDLSTTPPHVIAAVLKLYLRQLPEPLLSFDLYPDFMRVAKECFAVTNNLSCREASEEDLPGYRNVVASLRQVVWRLPEANFVTASRLIAHLKRVSEHEEDNAMSASNLGIVFGPTLLRPSETPSSLSSLVDMSYQSRTIELLVFHPEVFEEASATDAEADLQDPGEPVQDEPPEMTLGVPQTDQDQKEELEVDNPESSPHTPAAQSTPQLSPLGESMSFSSSREELDSSSNSPATQPTPQSINLRAAVSSPSSASPTSRRDLGFDKEFFELLARSNERKDEVNNKQLYQVPPFLLPGQQADDGTESDTDGEDDTTQGTSGSRTPDDDLGADKNPRSLPSSFENLSEDRAPHRSREPSVQSGSPVAPCLTPEFPDESLRHRSRQPSVQSGSSWAPSFSSDFPDDSLLPDLSDCVPPKLGPLDDSDLFRAKAVRPSSLGLRKRHSDLPGRVRRCDDWTGIFPVGIKSSNSYENVNSGTSPSTGPGDNLSSPSPTAEREGAPWPSGTGSAQDQQSRATVVHNEMPVLKEKDSALGERAMSLELIPDEREAEPPAQNGELSGHKNSNQAEEEVNSWTGSELASPAAESSLAPAEESHALVIPVNAAIQERRPSNGNVAEVATPSCSTARTGPEVGTSRVESPPTREKAEDGRGIGAKPRALARVSVKDRRRHYEGDGDGTTVARKTSSSTKKTPSDMSSNVIDVASRKQMFEYGGRGPYKRVSDLGTRKQRSGSAGSNKLPTTRPLDEPSADVDAKLINSDETNSEGTEVTSQSRKEKSEDRPRSLILDRISKVGTEYEPLLDVDKLQPVDIPLDNECDEADDNGRRKHDNVRRSPSPSSPRSKLAGRKGEEGREPQFV